MALRINTNVPSLAAQRFLNKSEARQTHALKALASGARIVNSGDDAAGLAISENLRGQMSGLKQARSNAENAISLIQVAEGGLNEQNNILIRLRELGIQAASDNITDTERGFLNQEFKQLVDEFDRIAKTTQFGSKKLLTGSGGGGGQFEFQVGPNAGPENVIKYTLDADTTGGNMKVDKLSIDKRDSARTGLADIDEALTKISGIRANFGAIQSRFQMAVSNLDIQYENVASARSRIADADIAAETAELVSAQVAQEAGVSVLAQANGLPQRAARLLNMT